MKFEVSISGWYECADSDLLETYGTTDPDKCCSLDQEGSVEELLSYMEDITVWVNYVVPKVSKP